MTNRVKLMVPGIPLGDDLRLHLIPDHSEPGSMVCPDTLNSR